MTKEEQITMTKLINDVVDLKEKNEELFLELIKEVERFEEKRYSLLRDFTIATIQMDNVKEGDIIIVTVPSDEKSMLDHVLSALRVIEGSGKYKWVVKTPEIEINVKTGDEILHQIFAEEKNSESGCAR